MLDLNKGKEQFNETLSEFQERLKNIRAGRPTPEMFNNIKVNAYGSESDLNSVANINIVDATLVTIQPWDKSLVEAVEKAIQMSDKGFNPQVSGDMIRIPIPQMTQDKRQEIVSEVKDMTEEAKIKVRQIRKEVMQKLDADKKSGDLPEDRYFTLEKQLQSAVDDANNEIDKVSADKQESIMQV